MSFHSLFGSLLFTSPCVPARVLLLFLWTITPNSTAAFSISLTGLGLSDLMDKCLQAFIIVVKNVEVSVM